MSLCRDVLFQLFICMLPMYTNKKISSLKRGGITYRKGYEITHDIAIVCLHFQFFFKAHSNMTQIIFSICALYSREMFIQSSKLITGP